LDGEGAVTEEEGALKGSGAIVPETHHSLEVITTLLLAKGGTDALIRNIEAWEDGAREKTGIYTEIIQGDVLDNPASDWIGSEGLKALVASKEMHLARWKQEELEKLGRFEAGLADVSSFQDVISLSQHLTTIGFTALAGDRNQGIEQRCACDMRLALSAETFIDVPEAQRFAGEIFLHQKEPRKALACARRLLSLGDEMEGERLIGYAAVQLGKEEVRGLAVEFESVRPLLSLDLYEKACDKEGYVRLAKRIIMEGPPQDVRKAAWSISGAFGFTKKPGRSILMRDAFARLESFGEDGLKTARGIKAEMGLDGRYEITELDTPDDLDPMQARILGLMTRLAPSGKN